MHADPTTEAEIKDTLNLYNQFYAARDLGNLMSLFAPDADTVIINTGTDARHVGTDAISNVLSNTLNQFGVYLHEYNWMQISSSGAVAWVSAEGIARSSGDSGDITVPIRFTAVLEKREGRWLFLQRHVSMPAS
jgi:ketosteroid isomerase-like protein